MSDYTPKHPREFMILGLLSQVMAGSKSVSEVDLDKAGVNTRTEVIRALLKSALYMIEAEIMTESNSLSFAMQAKDLLEEIEDKILILESGCDFTPLVDDIREHEEVEKVHLQRTSSLIEGMTGHAYYLCAHFSGDDQVPFLIDTKEGVLRTGAVLSDEGGMPVPVMDHPQARKLIADLVRNYPHRITVEAFEMPSTPEGHGGGPSGNLLN